MFNIRNVYAAFVHSHLVSLSRRIMASDSKTRRVMERSSGRR